LRRATGIIEPLWESGFRGRRRSKDGPHWPRSSAGVRSAICIFIVAV
jgi:hypothetical protein